MRQTWQDVLVNKCMPVRKNGEDSYAPSAIKYKGTKGKDAYCDEVSGRCSQRCPAPGAGLMARKPEIRS